MRIAILGGGGVGTCAALEIARHGHAVDLYERDSAPLMRASRVNEGKVHQGFLWGNDRSRRTVRAMARGALSFHASLARWLDLAAEPLHVSTPFIYAVHKDTMVGVEGLRSHYAACCATLGEMQAASGGRYLGLDEPPGFRELSAGELESILDPAHFAGAFVTSERSVDPRMVAARLRTAVLAEPRITFLGGTWVEAVTRRSGGGYDVTFDRGSAQREGPYDRVVNALWESRLAVDRSLGLEPPQGWMYRHKFGNRVNIPLGPADLPSVTMVLGPFGDIVNFGSLGFYLSWYPFGMVDTSFDLQPPRDWVDLHGEARYGVFARSLEKWRSFCPKLRALGFKQDQVDPSSGVIFAWGNSDIDDPDSKLHDRYEIGIRSVDGYHSVDTGKYTMVPYLGLKVAERVLGKDGGQSGLADW
jgi:hypothetical protein